MSNNCSLKASLFLTFLRVLRKKKQVGGPVQCRQFEVEARSRLQVRVGLYDTVGSTVQNLTACPPLRVEPTALDRGDISL